jgi:hypothetical protein
VICQKSVGKGTGILSRIVNGFETPQTAKPGPDSGGRAWKVDFGGFQDFIHPSHICHIRATDQGRSSQEGTCL